MPQVGRALVKERAARLRAKGDEALAAHLASRVGSEQSLLVEKAGLGRTACFAQARLVGSAKPGDLIRVRVTDATATHLIAEPVQ
jgi:threonylcarbamoyladenosine tRNA methylthiotransferase MtaB